MYYVVETGDIKVITDNFSINKNFFKIGALNQVIVVKGYWVMRNMNYIVNLDISKN